MFRVPCRVLWLASARTGFLSRGEVISLVVVGAAVHSCAITDLNMVQQIESGLCLKDDIASIWTDSTFHDVTLQCADGVKMDACRAVLASRSAVFKAMLYGNMLEAYSQHVVLHAFNSAALHVVLEYIYTEDISFTTLSIAVEVYRAASFFLLPKLMKLVLKRVQEVEDLELATLLLNEAVASIPWSEAEKDVYDVLLKPFCTHSLAVGDLNGLSEDALELLLTQTLSMEFKTSEYDLLLCVVDWAWSGDVQPFSDAHRHTAFTIVSDLQDKPVAKIFLKDNPSCDSLLRMLHYVNLTLVCPHRLKRLVEAMDDFIELLPQLIAFCHHACKNTKCLPNHPSDFRGKQAIPPLEWDRTQLGTGLVISSDGTVVEFPRTPSSDWVARTARLSTPCVAGPNGLCEWDIIIEATAPWLGEGIVDIGMVGEAFNDFETDMKDARLHPLKSSAWVFRRWSYSRFYAPAAAPPAAPGGFIGSGSSCEDLFAIKSGDVITFRLDVKNHSCTISVNSKNYGVVWSNLPDKIKLYPAVSLCPLAKYRVRRHV